MTTFTAEDIWLVQQMAKTRCARIAGEMQHMNDIAAKMQQIIDAGNNPPAPTITHEADPKDKVKITVRESPYFSGQHHLYVEKNGELMFRMKGMREVVVTS